MISKHITHKYPSSSESEDISSVSSVITSICVTFLSVIYFNPDLLECMAAIEELLLSSRWTLSGLSGGKLRVPAFWGRRRIMSVGELLILVVFVLLMACVGSTFDVLSSLDERSTPCIGNAWTMLGCLGHGCRTNCCPR